MPPLRTFLASFLISSLSVACEKRASEPSTAAPSVAPKHSGVVPGAPSAAARPSATPGGPAPGQPAPAEKIDFTDQAMGTEIHFVAYTDAAHDAHAVRSAMEAAFQEIRRIERLMSSWRDDSEVAKINEQAGTPVEVSPETFEVFEKSVWAGDISHGTFDVSFNVMRGVWRFGDAAEAKPQLPDPALVRRLRGKIDYRKIHLDKKKRTVAIEKGMSVGLGGIAKGYAVDRAVAVLRGKGLESFLAQAGGDLYGAGHKPDGSKWVSGIQDPRATRGQFFATIELEDRAFSTAGDYARAFVLDGKRYHHIIDPRTGYPATASRSVTVWAPDALIADAVDDAVFILGVKEGLRLVQSLDGVGVVIVDSDNQVHVSERIQGKVKLLRPPTGGI